MKAVLVKEISLRI